MRREWLALFLFGTFAACGEAQVYDPQNVMNPASTNAATNHGTEGGADADASVGTDAAASPDAGAEPDVPEPPPACGCPLGDGPYCGARAAAVAAEQGCELDPLVTDEGTLYNCESGVWSELQQCAGDCAFDGASTDLDDRCVLPECECFVQVAWCGSGAAKIAEERGCQIPLLPEHRGDILYCPNGEWAVREACDDGCVEAPTGTPDFCKTESDYLLPVPCPQIARCTNGNNTGTHTGKDHYAYDFGMPVGTDVVAIRGGTVHRVRNVSSPGSACYNGGGSSCANYANTVEIKHPDGTIGLYMHLNRGTVAVGDLVRQGQKIGVSGNTGWSTGPHLHVQVQQNCGSWWCQSIPFRFGERHPLVAGTTATSANCDD